MSSSLVKGIMRVPDFQFWFDAILNDNSTEMEKTLTYANVDMAKLLTNGNFDFQQMHSKTHPLMTQIAKCFHVSHPVQMAVVYGKKRAFQILIKYGGNIFVKDRYENNMLHLMCYVINGNPARETEARVFYRWLVDNISTEHMMQLLSQENSNNLNAETTAVALGTMGLFLDMLKTRGKDFHFLTEQKLGVVISYI